MQPEIQVDQKWLGINFNSCTTVKSQPSIKTLILNDFPPLGHWPCHTTIALILLIASTNAKSKILNKNSLLSTQTFCISSTTYIQKLPQWGKTSPPSTTPSPMLNLIYFKQNLVTTYSEGHHHCHGTNTKLFIWSSTICTLSSHYYTLSVAFNTSVTNTNPTNSYNLQCTIKPSDPNYMWETKRNILNNLVVLPKDKK